MMISHFSRYVPMYTPNRDTTSSDDNDMPESTMYFTHDSDDTRSNTERSPSIKKDSNNEMNEDAQTSDCEKVYSPRTPEGTPPPIDVCTTSYLQERRRNSNYSTTSSDSSDDSKLGKERSRLPTGTPKACDSDDSDQFRTESGLKRVRERSSESDRRCCSRGESIEQLQEHDTKKPDTNMSWDEIEATLKLLDSFGDGVSSDDLNPLNEITGASESDGPVYLNQNTLESIVEANLNQNTLESIPETNLNQNILSNILEANMNQNTLESILGADINQNTVETVREGKSNQNTLASILELNLNQNIPESVLEANLNQNTLESIPEANLNQNILSNILEANLNQNTLESILGADINQNTVETVRQAKSNQNTLASILEPNLNLNIPESVLEANLNQSSVENLERKLREIWERNEGRKRVFTRRSSRDSSKQSREERKFSKPMQRIICKKGGVIAEIWRPLKGGSRGAESSSDSS